MATWTKFIADIFQTSLPTRRRALERYGNDPLCRDREKIKIISHNMRMHIESGQVINEQSMFLPF